MFVQENRKVQFLRDIIQWNESIILCRKILEITEDQIAGIYKEIINFDRVQYFVEFIQYAIKIRPKNAENLAKLFCLIISEKTYYFSSNGYMGDILAYVGVIPKKLDTNKNSIEKILWNFEENSIEEAIFKDDSEAFLKHIQTPGFNPKKKTTILKAPIQEVLNIINRGVSGAAAWRNEYTYMQLIVYFGSVKCFKMVITNKSFSKKDLCHFAIAGGNIEIIKMLELKGYSFDECFETSTAFHQYDITDWLLNNHECQYNDKSGWGGSKCLRYALDYYNDAVFLFLFENGYGKIALRDVSSYNSVEAAKRLIADGAISEEEKSTLLHWASKNGNIDVVRYFVEESSTSINEKNIKRALQLAGNCCSSECKKKQVKEYLKQKVNK